MEHLTNAINAAGYKTARIVRTLLNPHANLLF